MSKIKKENPYCKCENCIHASCLYSLLDTKKVVGHLCSVYKHVCSDFTEEYGCNNFEDNTERLFDIYERQEKNDNWNIKSWNKK